MVLHDRMSYTEPFTCAAYYGLAWRYLFDCTKFEVRGSAGNNINIRYRYWVHIIIIFS